MEEGVLLRNKGVLVRYFEEVAQVNLAKLSNMIC